MKTLMTVQTGLRALEPFVLPNIRNTKPSFFVLIDSLQKVPKFTGNHTKFTYVQIAFFLIIFCYFVYCGY